MARYTATDLKMKNAVNATQHTFIVSNFSMLGLSTLVVGSIKFLYIVEVGYKNETKKKNYSEEDLGC